MKFFDFKDKNTNVSFRGIMPSTEIDCPPFEYFRLVYAYYQSLTNDDLEKREILNKTNEMLEQKLKESKPHPAIHQLLTDDTLSHKEQEKLLKGVSLTPTDILWMNKEAQDLGFLLNIYQEEKFPEKFKEKNIPLLIHKKKDNDIEKMGTTDMTEGEMRAILEQRKIIQARIYHKNNVWHCFYFTYKGLAGNESGLMGGKPHYHYFSNKSRIIWDDLMKRIKDCDMPSSKVHIIIERNLS
ncbi:MAG: hypothetical protein IKR89_03670 [Bacteroidaceae bacterium]|nr:hypothetical protein [Bacteroidaceae bacterium]